MIFVPRPSVTFRSLRVFQDDYASVIISHSPEILVGDRRGSFGGGDTDSSQSVRGRKQPTARTGFCGQAPP